MKASIAQINRLGNRETNEDRLIVLESGDSILLVLADGMGGHRGGEIAAQTFIDTLDKHFRRSKKPILHPQAFLKLAIESAHKNIIAVGKSDPRKIDPRTTCIVCLIQKDGAHWAHVGDSRLYLFRDKHILTRTIDHSFVEELFRKGHINEAEMLTHPKRSYLTQCIGGPTKLPDISYSQQAELNSGDLFLLCSDGLWAVLSDNELLNLAPSPQLEPGLNELAALAEGKAYPQSDNISAVALRMLEKVRPNKTPATAGTEDTKTDAPSDKISDAITDIHKALEDYSNEMDYDPDQAKR